MKTLLSRCLIVLFVATIATNIFAQSSNPQHDIPQRLTKTPLVDAFKTLGFIEGQRLYVDYIIEEYPDLAANMKLAQFEFDAQFCNAEILIKEDIKLLLKDRYQDTMAEMTNHLESMFDPKHVNHEAAVNFLEEVKMRTKGHIPSPIIEVLLTYQYLKQPYKEYSDDFVKAFRTKGHPKAKGLDIQIRHPQSWLPTEADRPNIVQRFSSENGHGIESVMLIVKDLPFPPNYKPSKQELKDFFTENEMKTMLPEGAIFVSAKPVVLDQLQGGMMVYEITRSRLDMVFTIRTVQYLTIYKNKMISIQCSVSTAPNIIEYDLQKRFERFEPLFKRIANSFIVFDQYE